MSRAEWKSVAPSVVHAYGSQKLLQSYNLVAEILYCVEKERKHYQFILELKYPGTNSFRA